MIGSDIAGIARANAHLHRQLYIWDLGTPKYLLGIKFTYWQRNLVLSQQKDDLDILTHDTLLGYKPWALPIDGKPSFMGSTSQLLVERNVMDFFVMLYEAITEESFTFRPSFQAFTF